MNFNFDTQCSSGKLHEWYEILLDKLTEDGEFYENTDVVVMGKTITATYGTVLYNVICLRPFSNRNLVPEKWFLPGSGMLVVSEYYDEKKWSDYSSVSSEEIMILMNEALHAATCRNMKIGLELSVYELYTLRKEYPKLVELMDSKIDENQSAYDFMIEVRKREHELVKFLCEEACPNIWGDMLSAKELNMIQVVQILVALGTRPGSRRQSALYSPIASNYFIGISDCQERQIAADCGRLIHTITHQNIRSAGHFDSLITTAMTPMEVESRVDCEDCHTKHLITLDVRQGYAKLLRGMYYLDDHDKVQVVKPDMKPGRYRFRTPITCNSGKINVICPTCLGDIGFNFRNSNWNFGPTSVVNVASPIYTGMLGTKHIINGVPLKPEIVDPGKVHWKIFENISGYLFFRTDQPEIRDWTFQCKELATDDIKMAAGKYLEGPVNITEYEILNDAGAVIHRVRINNMNLVADYEDMMEFQLPLSNQYRIHIGEWISRFPRGNDVPKIDWNPVFEESAKTEALVESLSRVKTIIELGIVETEDGKINLKTDVEIYANALLQHCYETRLNIQMCDLFSCARFLTRGSRQDTCPDWGEETPPKIQILTLANGIQKYSRSMDFANVMRPPNDPTIFRNDLYRNPSEFHDSILRSKNTQDRNLFKPKS